MNGKQAINSDPREDRPVSVFTCRASHIVTCLPISWGYGRSKVDWRFFECGDPGGSRLLYRSIATSVSGGTMLGYSGALLASAVFADEKLDHWRAPISNLRGFLSVYDCPRVIVRPSRRAAQSRQKTRSNCRVYSLRAAMVCRLPCCRTSASRILCCQWRNQSGQPT